VVRTAEKQRAETLWRTDLARARRVDRRWVTVAGVGALTLLCAWLGFRTLGYGYWVDESMSIGIASHPITEIPNVLRQDGTPPLFYILLHLWTNVFGTGEQATGAMSLVFAAACVPAAFWMGSSLFGRRAGWFCAVLTAGNGLVIRYSHETRMYTLMALLSLLATGAFLHAFVFRRRGYLVMFSLALCAMLYTHTWGVFFALAAALAVIPCWHAATNRRRVLLDALLAFGAAAVGFLPWVPNLLYQAAHTGAPWAPIPAIEEPVLRPILLWGGWLVFFVLFPVGGLGVYQLLRRRRSRATRAFLVGVVLLAGFILTAWANARINSGWSSRYFIAVLGPTILVAAVALARAGRVGTIALVVVAVVGMHPSTDFFDRAKVGQLSNFKTVSKRVEPRLQANDLVLVLEPGQVTTLRHYLGPEYRYATTMGPVVDPGVIDWRDVMDRLERADTRRVVGDLIDSVPVGGHVVVATPNFMREGRLNKYLKLVVEQGRVLIDTVTHDPRFEQQSVTPPRRIYPVGASAHVRVFERTS
jgi:hypothetical protein